MFNSQSHTTYEWCCTIEVSAFGSWRFRNSRGGGRLKKPHTLHRQSRKLKQAKKMGWREYLCMWEVTVEQRRAWEEEHFRQKSMPVCPDEACVALSLTPTRRVGAMMLVT